MYRNYRTQKYVIMIKHPLTLNVAVPRGTTWGILAKIGAEKDISAPAKITSAITHFERMMWGDRINDTSSKRCDSYDMFSESDMGWLASMESVLRYLRSDYAFSSENIRIVRYEDFASQPLEGCRKVLSFAMISKPKGIAHSSSHSSLWPTPSDVAEICDKLFTDAAEGQKTRNISFDMMCCVVTCYLVELPM